ncbi:MAG: Hsp33 family molecular chaperone HslO [Lachnospiraceae bacterium]|nr:Hsp33 family molecular chaperone HslO [Lachnospiraceae bacterium]
MSDLLIRGTACNEEVRFVAAVTDETVEEARRIHDCSPLCTAALGRLLTAGAMMGALLKNKEDRLTLKIDGDGPIRQLTVCSDACGQVRGLMYDPKVELPLKENGHLNVGGGIGRGTLTVIQDMGLKEPYSGQIPLVSGEIGEDLTAYFAESEQIPSSVGVGVLVGRDGHVLHAGGFLIQLLPFASEETISALEQSLSRVHSVTDCLSEGDGAEELIRRLLPDARVEQRSGASYHCSCDRSRVEKAMLSLGRSELDKMIAEGKDVTLHCDFCNKDYLFTIPEIRQLMVPPPSTVSP